MTEAIADWQINPPPIGTPAGLLLAGVVCLVMVTIGGWLGSGGLARFRESRAGNAAGAAFLAAVLIFIWKG